ncbi:MAG TPA: hypothetical protein VJV23_15965 [Candidatus Polarisedimenticolia bacterium]|nr:hypothetical protein [Candidatus Polarisedimenticolia bacterium]
MESEGGWTVLLRVRREETAEIVRGLLESNGLECKIIRKTASELPVPVVDTMSRFEIWVPETIAADAMQLLNDAREGTIPCRSCGHRSAPEEASCEHCGAPM